MLLLGDGGHFASLTERHMRMPRLDWQDDAWLARLFDSLSFSHLLELSRIDDPVRRAFYELECLRSGWSVRELKRQRESMLYERVGLSRDKDAVRAMAAQGTLVDTPESIIRDPYVLEFLGLGERAAWTESELEQALLDHLQAFLLELGRDFCFMSRQFRVTVDGRHHYLDLLSRRTDEVLERPARFNAEVVASEMSNTGWESVRSLLASRSDAHCHADSSG